MEKMSYIDMVMNKNSNYDESTDAIVPDLYPDIAKIIMVTGKAYVKDTSIQNDRVLISGEVKCEVLYIPEDSKMPVKMMVNLSFAHIEELKYENCLIFCKSDLSNIEARIINPRKISILANIMLDTKAYKAAEIKMDNSKYEGVQTLSNKTEVSLIDSINICECVLTDNVEFKGVMHEDYEMFCMKPSIVINDIKLLKNKIMIRGNIDFCGNYLENDNVIPMNASSAFSQIVDITITDEDLEGFIDVTVKNFDLEETLANEYTYSLTIKICLTQKRMENIEIISDMYDTEYEIDVIKTENTVVNTPKPEYENIQFTANIPCDDMIDNIMMVEMMPYTKMNENMSYDLCAHINGMYKSGNEIESFSYDHKIMENMNNSEIAFENQNIKANKNANNVIEIDANLKAKKYNDSKINIPIVSDVKKTIEKVKQKDEIILKYINNKKSVWDIAKEYSVTENDIIEANEMDSDTKNIENKMILIPKK